MLLWHLLWKRACEDTPVPQSISVKFLEAAVGGSSTQEKMQLTHWVRLPVCVCFAGICVSLWWVSFLWLLWAPLELKNNWTEQLEDLSGSSVLVRFKNQIVWKEKSQLLHSYVKKQKSTDLQCLYPLIKILRKCIKDKEQKSLTLCMQVVNSLNLIITELLSQNWHYL